MNDYVAKRGRAAIVAAEQKAKEFAGGYVERREAEAMALRDTALRELTAVRDTLDQLGSSSSEGRIAAAEYADWLAKLRGRQQTAEAQLDRVEAIVQDIEGVEADPIEWYDQLSRRLPHLKENWPW